MDRFGERLEPTSSPRMVEEHDARYGWAATSVRGLRVLDIATGYGRGADLLLAGGAREVIGVEVDADAVKRMVPTSCFRVVRADATRLPLRDASVDACVTLETIEHLEEPTRFIAEVARVLVQRGHLVLSTPNRESRTIPHANPYHLREFSAHELYEILGPRFDVITWAGQYFDPPGLRLILRHWLARSASARLLRRSLPMAIRSRGGALTSGPAGVKVVTSPAELTCSVLIVVARKRA